MKQITLKALTLVLCLAFCLSALSVISFAAEAEKVHVLSQTDQGDVSSKFFAWDTGNHTWPYAVTVNNGVYNFHFNGAANHCSQNLNLKINVNETPFLYYDVASSTKAFNIKLRPIDKNGDNKDKILVADAIGSGKIDLRTVTSLQNVITDEGMLGFNNFEMYFTSDEVAAGDTLVLNSLYFGPDENIAIALVVEQKIAYIGTVTLSKETLITQARAAYEALTSAQKALVPNLSVLEQAEADLAALKDAPPEPERKTETFLELFDDNTFPKSVATSTSSENDPISSVFGKQQEGNQSIYKYYFGNDYSKDSGIILKQMTDVSADIVYEFKHGLKNLEFVGSYIWASIFNAADNGIFTISWAETFDGTYVPFTASDIAYERVAMDENSPGYEPGKQSLSFYRIADIPKNACFIKLSFKGSDSASSYPAKYENWQVPLGYLKVESYKMDVKMENKSVTDSETGITVKGEMPEESTVVVTNKSGSGIETAAERYAESKGEFKNVLITTEILCLLNGEVFSDFDNALTVSIPVGDVADGKYLMLQYDEDIFDFVEIDATVSNGVLSFSSSTLGNFALLGNDAAAEEFEKEDIPTEENKPTTGTQDNNSNGSESPSTGTNAPTIFLFIIAGATFAMVVLRKIRRHA